MAPEGGCQRSGGTARARAERGRGEGGKVGGGGAEGEGGVRAGAASRTWEILTSLVGVGEREIAGAGKERPGLNHVAGDTPRPTCPLRRCRPSSRQTQEGRGGSGVGEGGEKRSVYSPRDSVCPSASHTLRPCCVE